MALAQLNSKATLSRFVNIDGSDGILCIHCNNNFVQLFHKAVIVIRIQLLLSAKTKRVEMSTPIP